MAEKIKCNCGITFSPKEGQTHCNYCGIKLSDVGKDNEAENKKKSQSIFSWLAWWRLDKEELQKQVKEYETLKITQSAKGKSFLFLLLGVIIATVAILFLNWNRSAFLYPFLYLILGFFIYKGHRWAMIGTMTLSTFVIFSNFYSSVVANSENGTPIINSSLMWALFFWTIGMHFYYLAFRVENERRKLTPILKDIPDSTFCYKCGEALEMNSKFCSKCGAKVVYPPKD